MKGFANPLVCTKIFYTIFSIVLLKHRVDGRAQGGDIKYGEFDFAYFKDNSLCLGAGFKGRIERK